MGKKLKPKITCIIHLANRGAGIPDGGLFSAEQFPKKSPDEPLEGQKPSRGAIEIKPTDDDSFVAAKGDQVTRYWKEYQQVLVTNYRDFVLVGRDNEGNPVLLESFRLTEDEKSFWFAASAPRSLDHKIGNRFVEFLHRVMLHAARLIAPEDLAWFMASHAREALGRVEAVELPALAAVRSALEEALGLRFEGERGEHFFRSSLVQTLFYGVFSAWVLWAKKTPPTSKKRFDWRLASWHLRVPMINKLFSLIADPAQLENLNLIEVLDWTGQVINRVDRASFFVRFQESHAVQYFYEPFLEAFDPELRKQLGVWFTPPEIVHYMVERVDQVLRSELGVPLGLADKNVYVLDPCCGTGSYLVEVINRIHLTLKKQGEDALLASDLKQAAKERVFGFEILPAPFVVSHLQLGLLLQNLGAPLSEKSKERVGVYLTNALTGWEPPKVPKTKLMFPELEEEREAAEHVKRNVPILVILGNPPYNAFAGVSPEEEQGLVEPYKKGLISEWGIKKFNLDDLYIRFFRLAERRIVQGPPGKGILCFISNFSYLSEPSYVVMRRRFLDEFGRIWIDCMNGDSRETGKLTPEGKPDPSVFSTKHNRAGIRKGTAIGLLVRQRATGGSMARLGFRDFWGATKNSDLVESLNDPEFAMKYYAAQPEKGNRYSFRPGKVSGRYKEWPPVRELSEAAFNGPVERRAFALISMDRDALACRIRSYFDTSVSDEEIRAIYPSLMMTGNRIVGPEARKKVLKDFQSYDEESIVRYPFKPFDVRWCYLENLRPLFSEPSPELLSQRSIAGNAFFVTRDTADKDPEGPPFYFSRMVCDYDCISGHARHFPVLAHPAKEKKAHQAQTALKLEAKPAVANLSSEARTYLAELGIGNPEADGKTARLIWMHALAVGYSPAYLRENADGIRLDWPRVPLPDSKGLLLASAELGTRIAVLLDTEATCDPATPNGATLQNLAVFSLVEKRPIDELSDLALTAGWGHPGKGGVTMPGKGKAKERGYEPQEMCPESALLGERTMDVYLNDAAYWKNVPTRVWEYTIGGYPVMKKWLSYRERKVLGRALAKDEVRYVSEMARRIASILLLEPELDENYQRVKNSTYPWPS